MIDLNELIITGATATSVEASRQLPHNRSFAVQVKWSGTSVAGAVHLEASLNGSDWLELPDSENTFAGSSGGFLYDVSDQNYSHVKVVCEATSGTVTFQVWLSAKRESNIG